MKEINIGVTGTGSLIGQAIIKSILNSEKLKSSQIIGFDYFENTIGSFWTSKNYLLPDLLSSSVDENKWVDRLLEIIRRCNIEILFCGVDFELPVLSKNKQYIFEVTGCIIVVSSENVVSIANDKYLTYKFLKENNIPYPSTYKLEDFEPNQLKFPFILKPMIGARSKGVYKVNNEKEYTSLYERITQRKNYIAQELVGSDDTEYTCGCIYFDGEVKHSIALQRELRDGNTWIARYSDEYSEEIYHYIDKIAKELKPFGSINFQLRLDKNNKPKLFEINPRFSGTTYIRSLFGYMGVEYIISYLLDLRLPNFELKEGVVRRFFDEFYIEG